MHLSRSGFKIKNLVYLVRYAKYKRTIKFHHLAIEKAELTSCFMLKILLEHTPN